MLINRLHQFLMNPLTDTTEAKSRSLVIFWFSLSLIFAVIYSMAPLEIAFGNKYVVQDDARQHIFWMLRFVDAGIFPNDIIADYFQSVAPRGYTTFYEGLAKIGIHPFLACKLLPLVLGVITTAYGFGCTMQLFPLPFAGFLAALFLNQNLWMRDDLVSATPVAFVYPLFIAFLYYFLRQSLLGIVATIILLGLFYPQFVFIASGILLLQLFRASPGKLSLSPQPQNYRMSGIGLGVAVAIMLPYALQSSAFGPVIGPSEAKTLWPSFFTADPIEFWLCGRRTGFLPPEWCDLTYKSKGFWLIPPQVAATFALPLILTYFSRYFPLAQQISHRLLILPQLLLVSIVMYFFAHAALFKLHLPNRYSEHNLRMITAIAGGIAVTLLLDGLLRLGIEKIKNSRYAAMPTLITLTTFTFIGLILIFYPRFVPFFPDTDYKKGRIPELYEFFAQQPKDILIASMAEETDNLPTFSQRSILVGPGYSLRYHQGYYAQMKQRAIDLVNAQYSPDLKTVQGFIKKYGIDFWVLDANALTPDYLAASKWIVWFRQVPTEPIAKAQADALMNLQQGKIPALSQYLETCSALKTKDITVLKADCVN